MMCPRSNPIIKFRIIIKINCKKIAILIKIGGKNSEKNSQKNSEIFRKIKIRTKLGKKMKKKSNFKIQKSSNLI